MSSRGFDEVGAGRHVLVIRIRPELAPRPVLVQRTIGSGDDKPTIFWIPVRIPGGTRQATRAELAALFARPPTLNYSPLADTLTGLTGLTEMGIYDTQRRGRPNTCGTATLTWEIASGSIPPFQMAISVTAPGQYSQSHLQALSITVEITSRLSAWMHLPDSPPGEHRRFEAAERTALLDAMTATLTDPGIVAAIADIADVDPILVPPPRILHVVSGPEIAGLLPPLPAIAR